MDRKTSNHLTSIVMPIDAQDSEHGMYLRLETFQLTLINAENG